jgi:hypothetical protein
MNTAASSSILNKIQQYKDNYYQSEGKNWLFKKNQKMDCAKKISEQFDLNTLIINTIYEIPNTNKILFDYTVFKLYASPDNYETIIQYTLTLFEYMMTKHASIEMNVILDTFTISAAERYQSVIQMFCNKCMTSKTRYSKCITQMNLYYTPSMIDSIRALLRPFIDNDVYERTVMYSKSESPEILKKLLGRDS